MRQNGPMLMGIEREAVEQWVREHVADLAPPFEWDRLVGGHSNLTYRVIDRNGTNAVIRRPPLGELLPKAHDMNREFRIISALWGTGVPVARPYGYCADVSVTGASFYVMGFVEGEPLGGAADVDTWLPEGSRRAVSESFADTMAALHLVDPVERGIGDLGRHDDFAGRQLKAWYGSWVSSAKDAEFDDPRVHAMHDYLSANKPPDGKVRLVHGDFGVHNCLVLPEGRISAVLDWEVASLGDPLSDLAYLLNMWVEPGEQKYRDDGMTAKPGFLRRADLVARYSAKVGGIDEKRLQYFRALNHWRSACIVHGVYTRYKRGQKSTEGVDMPRFLERIAQSVELADRAVAELRG